MIPLNQNLSTLKRSAIRVYTNLAKEVPGCVMLTIGEPDFDTPEVIKAAAVSALAGGQTHYAPNQGTAALRRAVADYETGRGHAVTPEQVLITVGATHALFTALLGILNPGEEVIVPTPGFGLYKTIATVAGAKTVSLDVTKTGFQITKEALNAAITPKTKAIILNSPCNPTGVVLNAESMANVKAAVLGKPIFVISDNVYNQLSDGSCPDLSLDPELHNQLILCQSFSKPYAMTGWRIGYLATTPEIKAVMYKLFQHTVTCVSGFIQKAAVVALDCTEEIEEMRQSYERRRDLFVNGLNAIEGVECSIPEGAFYAWVKFDIPGMDSEGVCDYILKNAKVVGVPGVAYGTDDSCVRFSFAASEEDLKRALTQIRAAMSRIQR